MYFLLSITASIYGALVIQGLMIGKDQGLTSWNAFACIVFALLAIRAAVREAKK